MISDDWKSKIYQLVVSTATSLPQDVSDALDEIARNETNGSTAADVMATITENIALARRNECPVCQDTGTIAFYIENVPAGLDKDAFEDAARDAVRRATKAGMLRPNCVQTLEGTNTGDNIGSDNPAFHWGRDCAPGKPEPMRVSLLLKGGGSENMSRQYSLPDATIGAGRDLDGVRRCLLHAVTQIQGCGCAPGILGVCIGGDRASGYAAAKEQLLRHVGERNSSPALAELESRVLKEANSLGIGPMGLGGTHALMEVFACARTRHPATYFVTVAYMCWCCRRRTILLEETIR